MEIAPVGVQMTYANANNAAQVQHNLNQEIALQQDYQAMREKNDSELKQKQVRTKDDTEGGIIKEEPDRRNRQGGYYQNNRRRRQMSATEQEEENYAVDPRRGHFVDVSS
ncbi:MAG: hypothetical protein K6G55_06045 [Selenomonadaceae bacterium]|nr:hypothetical protein [Selenomonadaceae bacterium]